MSQERFDLPGNIYTYVHWSEPLEPAKGLIIFLSALGVSIDYYKNLAKHWSKLGYHVARIEMRGMRYSSIENVKQTNFGYREILDIDLATIIPKLKEKCVSVPMWLCGHSLGGQLALLYAADQKANITGVIVIAGGSNHFATLARVQNRFTRQMSIHFVRLINRLLGYFPGHLLGFGGRQPKNLVMDWSYEGLTGSYKVQNSNKNYNQLLTKLELPVLLLSLEGDELVPKSCADALAQKLNCARVTQVELKAKDSGFKAFDHLKWSKQPQAVVRAMDNWMNSVSPI